MNHVTFIDMPGTRNPKPCADIACPSCEARETKVTDSRGVEDAEYIHRRRKCLSCGFRFSTHETVTPQYSGEIDLGAVAEKIARAEKSLMWMASLLTEIKRELGGKP